MKVENAREEFFKLCNDLQASNQKQTPVNKIAKPFVFEGMPQLQTLSFNLQVTGKQMQHHLLDAALQQVYIATPAQPPELV
jgi:hypothetical protein